MIEAPDTDDAEPALHARHCEAAEIPGRLDHNPALHERQVFGWTARMVEDQVPALQVEQE